MTAPRWGAVVVMALRRTPSSPPVPGGAPPRVCRLLGVASRFFCGQHDVVGLMVLLLADDIGASQGDRATVRTDPSTCEAAHMHAATRGHPRAASLATPRVVVLMAQRVGV